MTLAGRQSAGTTTDALWPALLASIALHGVLVLGMPDIWTVRPTPGGLTVRIAPAASPRAEARSASAALEQPRPRAPAAQQQSRTASLTPPRPASSGATHGNAIVDAPQSVDPVSAGQYRLALMAEARHHKAYPADAIDRRWQGTVTLRLLIGVDGALVRAQVTSSSGRDVLDREAVEMMRKATGATPIPPALRNRAVAVDIPVLFELPNDY